MTRPLIDVFAYQEALLIEAVLAVVILTMIWVGFRRWLDQKERMARLMAEQTAHRDAQLGVTMERVEERLEAIEQRLSGGGADEAAALEPPRTVAPGQPPVSHKPRRPVR